MIQRLLCVSLMLLIIISLTVLISPNLKAITTSGKKEVSIGRNELFNKEQHQGKLQIRYFHLEANEKSGDSILIKSPDGQTMLIDAGMVDTGDQLDRYLDQLSINKIDYAVATHPHHDHIGGYHTILQSRQIGLLLMPDLPHTTEVYSTLLNRMTERNIQPTYVKDGDRFRLGKNVEVEIISPSNGALEKAKKEKKLSTKDINNLSLVIKLTYNNHSFLFTSDIYKKQERKLVHLKEDLLDVDVLDAPHHGDSTSSLQAFINTVKPSYTMMSANIFQSKKVYERYLKSGSEVYATSMYGNILIVSDGEHLKIIPEKIKR
ncbi:ComEC/Rec2 family competence protein [Alkalihalobacillus deserti]|uniref:ComEC/Rec2 family competence protein n=1 Tax=Alkalihalobacillus deserti TaxID=2879466 RepID=UPI001D13FC8A|nr:MBL fold metallo-hydrolase [Alkalihalobacillus deserti]